MAIQRMDNVGIVVDDLEAAIAFFTELGMELEGTAQIEGLWADRTVGLDGVRSDIAMMRTPDGHSQLELATYHTPAAVRADEHAGSASGHVRRRRHRRRRRPPARPRCRTPRRGGAVRGQLPALLPPRPRGDHRRPGRTDQLTARRGRPATNQNDPLDGPRTTMGGITVQPNEITEVLNRPISQKLLARDVTRLAYVAKDGTPRNVPIIFTWNGSEIVMCTSKNAPKLQALSENPMVALTIDTEV